MEGMHPIIGGILFLGLLILYFLSKQGKNSNINQSPNVPHAKSTESSFESQGKHQISTDISLSKNNLTKSESQDLTNLSHDPASEIVRFAEKMYSNTDLIVHDLNLKGRIEITIAETRIKADKNSIYKFLLSKQDIEE